MVKGRLEYAQDVTHTADPYNGGFKKGSQTSDNMLILYGAIEKCRYEKCELYVAFVDFKRAFDTVHRGMMFYKLMKKGFEGKLVDVLRNMYSKTKSQVKKDGMLSDYFNDESGVNQGAILSPFLFTSFLADMVEYLDKKVGIQLDDDTTLTHLLWADDLVLFSTSPEGLQCQIDKLFTYCCRWQLIVNTAKTNITRRPPLGGAPGRG